MRKPQLAMWKGHVKIEKLIHSQSPVALAHCHLGLLRWDPRNYEAGISYPHYTLFKFLTPRITGCNNNNKTTTVALSPYISSSLLCSNRYLWNFTTLPAEVCCCQSFTPIRGKLESTLKRNSLQMRSVVSLIVLYPCEFLVLITVRWLYKLLTLGWRKDIIEPLNYFLQLLCTSKIISE